MVPGYIEAEDDPLQMEIQGDKRQSQSAEITALEKQSNMRFTESKPMGCVHVTDGCHCIHTSGDLAAWRSCSRATR